MSNNLEILFNNVRDQSCKLRKSNPKKFDGQGFWQPIKKMLEPLDKYKAKKWKPIPKSITKKIMLLPEYTIDGYETKVINENNHFIIQQVRIPLNEEPTIRKIIQIALNIGQYRGTNNDVFIYGVKFSDLSEFISKPDIIRLSKYIDDDIVDKINEYLY